MDAWPMESTKRSRLGQIGSSGSKRSRRFQRQYATGAMAMGVPGCPELAACTASMARQRMVLTANCSIADFVAVRAIARSSLVAGLFIQLLADVVQLHTK